MQEAAKHKKKIMVLCDIPAEHHRIIHAIRYATGHTVSQMFSATLGDMEDGFEVRDVPLGYQKRRLRLYLDVGLKRKLDRMARNRKLGLAVVVRSIIARKLV